MDDQEQELVENYFDALCSCLMLDDNKARRLCAALALRPPCACASSTSASRVLRLASARRRIL